MNSRTCALAVVLLFGCAPDIVPAVSPPAVEDGGADACAPPAPVSPTCSDPGPCAVATPDRSGGCEIEVVPGCAVCATPACERGTNRNGGACCAGCWAGSTCRPEPSSSACGLGGSLCVPCDGAEACVDGVCSLGPR